MDRRTKRWVIAGVGLVLFLSGVVWRAVKRHDAQIKQELLRRTDPTAIVEAHVALQLWMILIGVIVVAAAFVITRRPVYVKPAKQGRVASSK